MPIGILDGRIGEIPIPTVKASQSTATAHMRNAQCGFRKAEVLITVG